MSEISDGARQAAADLAPDGLQDVSPEARKFWLDCAGDRIQAAINEAVAAVEAERDEALKQLGKAEMLWIKREAGELDCPLCCGSGHIADAAHTKLVWMDRAQDAERERDEARAALQCATQTLERLASPEAFDVAQSISGPLADETRMRMTYAEDAAKRFRHLLDPEGK